MVPLEGLSSPATRFSRVDFPLPDGPITATASPAVTSRLTRSRAGAAPAAYRFVTALSWIRASMAGVPSRSGPAAAGVLVHLVSSHRVLHQWLPGGCRWQVPQWLYGNGDNAAVTLLRRCYRRLKAL